MRVVVTGGAGFVGSHLADRLLLDGHEVAALDNLSTGFREHIPKAARFFECDIRADLDDVFRVFHADVVVHLAAHVSVPDSVNNPLLDLSVNVAGTVNLLEAAARWDVGKVIALSSGAVYGVPESLPLVEESRTIPISPYGLSKLTAEHYIRTIGSMRSLPYTILRPANIYGPRQTTGGEGAVIPSFIKGFLGGHGPVMHGNGSQTRDFIFVSDMVDAIMCALTRADGLTLNVSSANQTSIYDLWTHLAACLGWKHGPKLGPARVGDISASVLSNAPSRQHLGWEPHVSLQEGLAHTVRWAMNEQVVAARLAEPS